MMLTAHLCRPVPFYNAATQANRVLKLKNHLSFVEGHDTKAMLNNSGPRYKRSKLERDINLDVIACVVILFTLCFLGGVGKLPFVVLLLNLH